MTSPVISQLVKQAHADRRAHRLTVRRILIENGLSIVLFALFIVTWLGQGFAGWHDFNQSRQDHGRPLVKFITYLRTGHFLEASSENWESEFLQMAAFVWLTSFLFQKGSPESRDPYEPEGNPPVTKDSPWPVRQRGWVLKLYENSLAIAFLALFVMSFVLHMAGGAREYSREQAELGQPGVSAWEYLHTSRFWFESLQNWQSEFLSIGAMVVLAIFLRQRGSPESKPVPTPHSQNE
jgi:hypothetical protein